MDDDALLEEPRVNADRRAELSLGALSVAVVLLLLAMFGFILVHAWPSFAHNGLGWFGPGGNVDKQLEAIFTSGSGGPAARPVYTFHAWSLIWGTILTTVGAVSIAFVCALFISVFVVEFAPEWLKRLLEPVIRLLASVPSVIYGLVAVLVLVPFINNNFVTPQEKASVTPVISLTGYGLLASVLVLTVMVAPLMIAVFAEGLRTVPRGWIEGSLGLGVNRWRTFWKIAVRTAPPALIAGTVLATARALGEAVMLEMVSGGVGHAPNPADGFPLFIFEPLRTLASTIISNGAEGFSSAPMKATLYSIASVLLFSAFMLSLVGWAIKRPMKRYLVVGGGT
jgi:ABC-type phosphate transport system permease subunit